MATQPVMPPITAVMAHFEISRAGSSLFFNHRYKIQPMMPAHKTASSTPDSFGESQFMNCVAGVLAAAPPGDPASGLVGPFGDPVRVTRAAQGGVVADLAATVEFVKTVVHQHHPVSGAGLDAVFQLMQIVFANQVAHGAVGDEQLVSEHAPRTVHRRQQFLGY